MRSSARWALSATCISAAAIGAAILYRFDPATAQFYPHCVFHDLTGLQCPGCGTTRALHHLLHGDVAGALRLNAMLFAGVPFGIVATASRRVATHPMTGWVALGVTVSWWLVRNLLHA
jgi:hypothetical protein